MVLRATGDLGPGFGSTPSNDVLCDQASSGLARAARTAGYNWPSGVPPTWFPEQVDRDSLDPGYNFVDNANFFEEGQFFYHRDVFGSTNFVTDQKGYLKYHVEYAPSGEVFYLDSDGTEVRPNLYADRDLDEESGNIYFEGHYLDPATGLFANPGYDQEYAGLGDYVYDISNMGP